ncbi:MAG: flagellar hook-length control protein FliK [Treponema sp.]|nr:flagellar hook-length control protein FliK [Treponema sp.]
MSFQAITDIIVNPQQLQDLQVSNTVKDSPKTTSTVSFADILQSVQSDNSVKETSPSQEKTTSVQEEKPVTKEEEISKSEETEKSSKVEEKKSDNEVKKEVKDEKVDTKSDVKIAVKEVEKEKLPETEKKLTSKDFARINQLAEKEESEKETAIEPVLVAENLNVNQKIEKVSIDEVKVEVENPEVQIETAINVASNQQMENETSEFNFSENKNEKQKVTFDKEGKITVQDMRTEPSEEIKLDSKDQLKITEVKQTGENTAQITIDLNQNANADVLALNNQSAAADGSTFQAMLNNQIQNNAPEFVKAGNLILKDNNQGTIDLVLHPDDLGNVKIHLSLDGKTVSGQITVNSKEALQVFKDNAETLREAFIKSGFDGASFDVAFNNGGSSNQNFGFEQQNDGINLLGKKVYGNSAEAVSGDFDAAYMNDENYSNYSVNIVA